ncbi:MAG: MBOAT family O-acyltransferase [Eubacteriales bacterium]|nr:MBOAT family O-acyltransferase [Eubacteriales bacterium]
MIFSSYKFIFGFLPIVAGGYGILNKFKFYYLSKIWLVLASMFFYSQGSPDFFPFFLGSVFANYVAGSALCRMQGKEYAVQRKLLLAVSVLGNIALLGYYKYYDFFIENVNAIAGTDFTLKGIILPIGISFFTFQLIAFLVDSYRGETKEYHVLDYLLFITFFPQLIVGPIVHHKEITPQFENTENMKLNYENIALGVFVFAIGCAKKMLLADPLNNAAADFYAEIGNNTTFLRSWYYTIAYSVSYYFDLSGYTDMAIGLGLFFNIKLPENFNAPFRARNFQVYWQRQHMTLSRFLGAYVFKSVFRKGNKWRNYYVATMATFLVSGIWHGAGWNFVVWGIMNGVLVCIAAYLSYHKKEPPYWIGVTSTFFFIVLTRVIFVAQNMQDALLVYKAMFNVPSLFVNGLWAALQQVGRFILTRGETGVIVLIGLLICWFAPTTKTMSEKFKPNFIHFAYTAVLLAICLSKMNQVVQFLYFQF